MSTPNGPYDPYPPQPQEPGQQPSYGQPSYGQQPGYGQPYSPYPQGPGGAPYGGPGYGAPYPPAGGPDGYLRGGQVGFGDAIRLAVQNSFVYQGRASRSAYWWFALVMAIAYVIVLAIGVASGSGAVLGILYSLFAVGVLLVGLSLSVRRMHDTNRSGWWLLLSLIPFGGLVVLVFSLLPGTPGPNRFG